MLPLSRICGCHGTQLAGLIRFGACSVVSGPLSVWGWQHSVAIGSQQGETGPCSFLRKVAHIVCWYPG